MLYSPHPCCDPLLIIEWGKKFSSMLTVVIFLPPYLQWSVFFVSPTPPSTPPKNQRLEPENTPLGKGETLRNHQLHFSTIHGTHLLSKLQHKGCILRQRGKMEKVKMCGKRDTPYGYIILRSLKETNC